MVEVHMKEVYIQGIPINVAQGPPGPPISDEVRESIIADVLERIPKSAAVDAVEAGNMNPVTSNAVHVLVGNVEAVMDTI